MMRRGFVGERLYYEKVDYSKRYNKISIWNGIIGERILNCHLIISNSKIANRLRVRKLDLVNVRRDFNFPNISVGTIR